MPPLPTAEQRFPVSALIWLVTGLLSLALVVIIGATGLVLALILFLGTWLMLRGRPQSQELMALRSSVILSAEDIRTTLESYRCFRTSTEQEWVLDRTLHRPELANPWSEIPDIATFYRSYPGVERFLKQLEGRLENPRLSRRQLEKLLSATDALACNFEQQWQAARQAALRLRGLSSD